MSFKKFFEKVEADLGIFGNLIESHAGVVLSVEHGMLTALQNPTVDVALAMILPPAITSHIPQAEAYLQKAITDTMAGTQIEKDIAAQPTLEGKLKTLLADIQALPGVNSAFVRTICTKFLALIDNKALSEELYGLYLSIQAQLSKA